MSSVLRSYSSLPRACLYHKWGLSPPAPCKAGRLLAGVDCSAVQCSVLQCSAVQCSAVQCSAVQCSAVQCSAVQCSAVYCRAVQCSAVQCSSVQCSVVQCSALQGSAEKWCAVKWSGVQQRAENFMPVGSSKGGSRGQLYGSYHISALWLSHLLSLSRSGCIEKLIRSKRSFEAVKVKYYFWRENTVSKWTTSL